MQLAFIDGEKWLTGQGRAQHFQAHRRRSRWRVEFVWRARGGHEDHLSQLQLLERLASQDEMGVMDRIERAAVYADALQRPHYHRKKRDVPACACRKRDLEVRHFMKTDQLGQLLLTGVPGTELDADAATLFRSVQPGGYILFGRNITSAVQLRKLIDDLRDLSDVEPIITIDQEGGRVSRLRLIGNEPPSAQQLREKDDVTLVQEHGRITGRLLRLFGFNLDLCPVLDISFDDEADNSLRGRCYGKGVAQVVRLAGAFNDALRQAGIASCGKHFPGYSAAQVDAHHDLPRIDRSLAELEANELAVFRQMAARVDSMMICHGWYPSLEREKLPASFSARIVTQLLRDDLKFEGLVMTDDLDMGAIYNEYGLDETIRLALGAGNDLAMICHRVDAIGQAREAIATVPAAHVNAALENVARFKSRISPPDSFSEAAFRQLDNEVWKLRVAVLGEERAAERSPEDGKRSPVETY